MSGFASILIRTIKWGIFTLILAGFVHIGVVLYLPSFVMDRLTANIEKTAGFNEFRHAPLPSAEPRGVVRSSPDLLYSICAFDLKQGPVRVNATVPPDNYWSLSIYGGNSDNFFAINDRQAGLETVNLLLAKEGREPDNPEKLPVIESPSPRGVIVTRSLVSSRDDIETLAELRQSTTCTPYVAPEPPEIVDEGPTPIPVPAPEQP